MTIVLNSVEKLRHLAKLWNPLNQVEFHLIALSDFWGPLLDETLPTSRQRVIFNLELTANLSSGPLPF